MSSPVKQIRGDDGEIIRLNERGVEARSDDESDTGEDLVGFIIDDAEIVKDDAPAPTIDPTLIVTGKRTRKAPERYIDERFVSIFCTDKVEAKELFGKKFDEVVRATGITFPSAKKCKTGSAGTDANEADGAEADEADAETNDEDETATEITDDSDAEVSDDDEEEGEDTEDDDWESDEETEETDTDDDDDEEADEDEEDDEDDGDETSD